MPCLRATAPILAAGLMRPPLVGIWVTAMSFTRPSIIFSSAGIELAVRVVGHRFHRDAAAFRHLQIGNVVADVFRLSRENAVAGQEFQRVEGHVPGPRRILDQSDLAWFRVNRARHGLIDTFQPVICLGCRLIAADPCFQFKMIDHRLQNPFRRRRRAGVVEMRHVAAARRVLRSRLRSIGMKSVSESDRGGGNHPGEAVLMMLLVRAMICGAVEDCCRKWNGHPGQGHLIAQAVPPDGRCRCRNRSAGRR